MSRPLSQEAEPAMETLRALCAGGADAHAPSAARLDLGIGAITGALGGGLARHGLHEVRHELARDVGAATGFTLGLLRQLGLPGQTKLIWIADPRARLEGGGLFPHGLMQFGLDPADFTLVTPHDAHAALWAADEAARCHDVTGVVIQTSGRDTLFDIGVTQRLAMHARESGVFVCALRHGARQTSGAMATRWQVEPLPSLPLPSLPLPSLPLPSLPDPQLPATHTSLGLGPPCWRLTLEKNRAGPTGAWRISWNPRKKGFDHAAEQTDAPLHRPDLPLPGDRPDRPRKMGHVMAFGRAS